MYRSYRAPVRRAEKDPDGLSLLAKGHGLLDGSVEIECYSTEPRTLMGKPFLKPSRSKEGQYAKMTKPHCLNLPKTYVTRRGPLILFTAPEDMVIGQPCQVQERHSHVKCLARQAANDLETTNNLAMSALTYDTEKDSGISDEEYDLSSSPRLGHFTKIYLDNLAKLQQTGGKSTEEGLSGNKADDSSHIESDSGFDSHPTTSGRLSAFSNQSETSMPTSSVTVPYGQKEYDDSDIPSDYIETSERDTHKDKGIEELMESLSLKTPTKSVGSSSGKGSTSKKKQSSNVGTKKKSSSNKEEVKKGGSSSHAGESCTGNANKKGGKKRTKKVKKPKEQLMTVAADKEQLLVGVDRVDLSSKSSTTELTINDDDDNGECGDGVRDDDNSNGDGSDGGMSLSMKRRAIQSARAENRKLEIERKRKEKKELEMQKIEEKERQLELLKEISTTYHDGEDDDNGGDDDEEDVDIETVKEKVLDIVSAKDIEQPRHKEIRLNRVLSDEESPAARKAREMKEKEKMEEQMRKQRLLEELRLKQIEEERLLKLKKEKELSEHEKRVKEIKEVGEKLTGKEELNYKMRLELEAQKFHDRKTPGYLFSYFRYLPNNKQNNNNNKNKRKSKTTTKKK